MEPIDPSGPWVDSSQRAPGPGMKVLPGVTAKRIGQKNSKTGQKKQIRPAWPQRKKDLVKLWKNEV